MWKDFPNDVNPEAAKDALLLGGAFWGFVVAAYGLFQLALLGLAFVIENKLMYYVGGALIVATLGGTGHLLFRRNAKLFGWCEVLIGMAIGGHLVHIAFSSSSFTPLAVLNVLVQIAGAIFLFVRGCRDIASK